MELRGVSKSFNGVTLLDDISLVVEEGQFIIIYGESGSGKSTILNIMGLLEQDFNGEVIIDGHVNPKINDKKGKLILRNKISYLFQNYGLIDNETVFENLSIVFNIKTSKSEKTKQSIQALENVGLDKSYMNRKVYTLSGGEQQRVALSKIIIKDSNIILCDEPTGSLDEENKMKILTLLKAMPNKTIVMVSHDKDIIRYADSIFMIKNGKLVKVNRYCPKSCV